MQMYAGNMGNISFDVCVHVYMVCINVFRFYVYRPVANAYMNACLYANHKRPRKTDSRH